MYRKSHLTSLALLLLSAILFIWAGCSHDGSSGSVDSFAGDDLHEAVQSIYVEDNDGGPIDTLPDPTFVATFSQNSNLGNWSFFANPRNKTEIIEGQGGNPGAFLHARCGSFGCLDSFAPMLHTQMGVSSVFTGGYRARGVTMVGVDLIIFGPDILVTIERPLSVYLRHDNGTQSYTGDDIFVTFCGHLNIPMPNGQFRSYAFTIPSQSTTLPRGWQILPGTGTGDDDADWNRVMSNVSQLMFFFGDPSLYYCFQNWDIGVDNVRIWLSEQ